MLSTLIQKELKGIILSPKFTATFAICSILILLSVFTGIREYEAVSDQYDSATSLVEQELQDESNWGHMSTRSIRKPDPMQIFVSGLTYDIGRWSHVESTRPIKLKHSPYSDDPIFAMFRHIDFVFIFQFVLSLFAILFTFDAINGERESGMLKLVFSNSIPRAKYLIAKIIGSWLGLILPISIPILLSILLVIIMGVPMNAIHWATLATLIALSVLMFTFFISLGVAISAWTKRSSVSFLLSLVIWVMFVLIIPRASVAAAEQMVPVPRISEIESIREAYANDRWKTFYDISEERWMTSSNMNEEESEEERDRAMWDNMVLEDSLRRIVEIEIEEYEVRLLEELRQRKAGQERLAFGFSRISPSSAYQLAASGLAGTDIEMKDRFEESMSQFRSSFVDFTEKKQAESGNTGGIMISISTETGIDIKDGSDNSALDLTDIPKYEQPRRSYAQAFNSTIIDFGLLAFATLLMFVASFIGFLRYDVR